MDYLDNGEMERNSKDTVSSMLSKLTQGYKPNSDVTLSKNYIKENRSLKLTNDGKKR